jgi:hypothetical protein
MKKKYYWTVGAVVIVCLIITVLMFLEPSRLKYSYPYDIQSEWKDCIEDKDCYLVYQHCCSGNTVSLNIKGKESIENWKFWNCINIDCLGDSVPSVRLPLADPEAICSSNTCSIKYNVNSVFCNRYCLPFECNLTGITEGDRDETAQELQNELEKVNISFEEAKSQCNCPEQCLWNAKVETCASLQVSPNLCKPSTDSIRVKDFDANKNGEINDSGDTLFELCKNYFNKNTDLECKDFCDC